MYHYYLFMNGWSPKCCQSTTSSKASLSSMYVAPPLWLHQLRSQGALFLASGTRSPHTHEARSAADACHALDQTNRKLQPRLLLCMNDVRTGIAALYTQLRSCPLPTLTLARKTEAGVARQIWHLSLLAEGPGQFPLQHKSSLLDGPGSGQ